MLDPSIDCGNSSFVLFPASHVNCGAATTLPDLSHGQQGSSLLWPLSSPQRLWPPACPEMESN